MKSSTFNSHYSLLGDLLALLTDYHANGAYEKLKENVTLLDKENYAVMIRTTNFESKNFSENFIYVDKHAYEYLKKSKVYPDDLIMNKIANPGTVYFMPNIGKPVSLGMNLFLLRIDKSKADPYFVYSFLRQNEDYVKSFASGSTTKTITKDDVRKLRVYSPPLPEQIKIAEILSTWDNAINTVQKLLVNSQQQKKALMQQLLTGKKRFAGFEGEWEEKRLGDILCESKISSLTSSPTKRITIRLHLKGVEKRDFRGTESIDSTAHFVRRKGQFIYGKQNFHKGAFGIIPDSLDYFESSQDLPAFDFIGSNCPRWFYYYFAREEVYAEFENLMSGTGSKRLNPKVFLNEVLFVPSLPEQQKIAAVLTTADQEIDNLCVQLNHLKQEKKALMQQLLTGKRRVKIEESA